MTNYFEDIYFQKDEDVKDGDAVYFSAYLPKKYAERAKEMLDSRELYNKIILEHAKSASQDLEISIAGIGEDLVSFKAYMISARKAFKEALEEELASNEKLWEDYNKQLKGTTVFVNKATNELKPLEQELKETSALARSLLTQMEGLQTYKLEHFNTTVETTLKLLQQVNALEPSVKELFTVLLRKEG